MGGKAYFFQLPRLLLAPLLDLLTCTDCSYAAQSFVLPSTTSVLAAVIVVKAGHSLCSRGQPLLVVRDGSCQRTQRDHLGEIYVRQYTRELGGHCGERYCLESSLTACKRCQSQRQPCQRVRGVDTF